MLTNSPKKSPHMTKTTTILYLYGLKKRKPKATHFLPDKFYSAVKLWKYKEKRATQSKYIPIINYI